jgi:hypothetical protein
MDVNEQIGQGSFEHPGEIVAVCEAYKNRSENHRSHAGEKKIVEAAVAPVADHPGCHSPPKTSAQSALWPIKPPANQSFVGVELDCPTESNSAKSGTTSSAKNPSDACTSRLLFPPFCWPARL